MDELLIAAKMADATTTLPPDENRGPEILIICGTLVGLSLVMVVLRLWVRISLIRQVGSDDYTMVAAMVSTDPISAIDTGDCLESERNLQIRGKIDL